MDLPLGKLPDQPGIHRAEKKFAPLRRFSGSVHIIQDPFYLRCGKICVRDQAGFFLNLFTETVPVQFFDHIRGPAALPHNGGIYGIAGPLIPYNRRLSLIRDPNSRDIAGIRPDLAHGFYGHRHLGRPDLVRIVLHPTGMRIILGEFFLRKAADISLFVKEDAAGTCGTLIQCHDILSHNMYLPLSFLGYIRLNQDLLCGKNIFPHEISQHQYAKHDPVPAESLEIMLLDISHKEFDRQNGYHKSHHNSCNQYKDLA